MVVATGRNTRPTVKVTGPPPSGNKNVSRLHFSLQIEPGRHVKAGGGKGPPEKNHPDIIGGGELFLTRMIPMAVRIE